MRTAFLSVIALAICCIAASTASASIFSNFLTFDGPDTRQPEYRFRVAVRTNFRTTAFLLFLTTTTARLGVGDQVVVE